MNAKVNKNFLKIDTHSVMYYSLKAFENKASELIVVTNPMDIEKAREVTSLFSYESIKVIEGGAERYDSVISGLDQCSKDYVFIHDCARCLIKEDVIDRCVEAVIRHDACIAAMPVKDTIKVCKNSSSTDENPIITNTPARSNLWQAQTPQTFKTKLIRDAYHRALGNKTIGDLTDDAQTLEQMGIDVFLVRGDYSNIKITDPGDIVFAKAVLQNK